MPPQKKIIHNYWDVTVELPNGNGNGRELGIDRREKWEWDLSFRWEWKWDGNRNEVIEMGGIWYKKSVPAHLYFTHRPTCMSELINL